MGRHERRAREKIQEKLLRKAQREVPVFEAVLNPQWLFQSGPIIGTFLTVTDAHAEALRSAGRPVPEPVRCSFLIDTGADGSVVKHEFAEKAGLKLINENVPLHGVGIDTTGRSYMGRILFIYEHKSAPGVTQNIWIDTTVMGAKLEADRIDGLLGRDVLSHFEFIYNGQTGNVRLRYLSGR